MSQPDRTARTLLAVPITHAETPIDEQVRRAIATGADLVELRVDLIGDVEAVEAYLKTLNRPHCILTIRSHTEGGKWDGDDDERIALYERLGMLNPGFIDVELRTWQRSANVRQKLGLVCRRLEGGEPVSGTSRPKNDLILSLHDFRSDVNRDQYWQELLDSPAPIVKLAMTPQDATGAVELLQRLSRSNRRSPIVIAMSEAGLCTRVLAKKCGAFLSFAATDDRSASAPGQVSVQVLRDLYRWDEITPHTRVYGVIGWPVAHSRSPHVHNAWIRKAGIDAVYLPFPVRPRREDFHAFMRAVSAAPELDFAGFSVTIPHKEHAFEWLETRGGRLSDWAQRCRAVNTLRRSESGDWEGDNTDAQGALHALGTNHELRHSSWLGRKVAVLGAGGAARAILAALSELGCALTIYNRTRARAELLARKFKALVRPWEERTQHAAQLLINCTSIGLAPAFSETPMPREGLLAGCIVFDTIYNPAQTQLLQDAAEAGCGVIAGMEMFHGQAAAQFRWWHGTPPP